MDNDIQFFTFDHKMLFIKCYEWTMTNNFTVSVRLAQAHSNYNNFVTIFVKLPHTEL